MQPKMRSMRDMHQAVAFQMLCDQLSSQGQSPADLVKAENQAAAQNLLETQATLQLELIQRIKSAFEQLNKLIEEANQHNPYLPVEMGIQNLTMSKSNLERVNNKLSASVNDISSQIEKQKSQNEIITADLLFAKMKKRKQSNGQLLTFMNRFNTKVCTHISKK